MYACMRVSCYMRVQYVHSYVCDFFLPVIACTPNVEHALIFFALTSLLADLASVFALSLFRDLPRCAHFCPCAFPFFRSHATQLLCTADQMSVYHQTQQSGCCVAAPFVGCSTGCVLPSTNCIRLNSAHIIVCSQDALDHSNPSLVVSLLSSPARRQAVLF